MGNGETAEDGGEHDEGGENMGVSREGFGIGRRARQTDVFQEGAKQSLAGPSVVFFFLSLCVP